MDAWQFLKWLYWGFERANQRWTYLDLEPSLGSRMMLLLTILQNKQIPAVNINNRLFEVRFDSQHINLILFYRVMNKMGCVFLVVIRSEWGCIETTGRRIPLSWDVYLKLGDIRLELFLLASKWFPMVHQDLIHSIRDHQNWMVVICPQGFPKSWFLVYCWVAK